MNPVLCTKCGYANCHGECDGRWSTGTADTQAMRAVRDTDRSEPPDPDAATERESLPDGFGRISHIEIEKDEAGKPTLEQRVDILEHTSRAIADGVSRVNATALDVLSRVAKMDRRSEAGSAVSERQNRALTILLAHAIETKGTRLSQHVLLVAEDDELLAPLLGKRLSEAGALVFYERDALHARARLEQIGPPHLSCAIIDIRLPDTQGLELARDIRRRAPHCGIVLTSGADLDVYAEDAEREQYALLNKPFDPHELIDGVLAAIQLRSAS